MDNEQRSSGFWALGLCLILGLIAGSILGWRNYVSVSTAQPENFLVRQAIDARADGSLMVDPGEVDTSETYNYPVAELVNSATHNFGVGRPGVMMEYTFMIRNSGNAPLTLKLQETTCKCLTMTLDKEEATVVQPGEEFPVQLQFRSDKATESFVQQARIKTNDPHPTRNTLKLKVEGRIVSRTTVRPDGLEVSDLQSANSTRFNFNLYTFAIDDIDPATIQIDNIKIDNALLEEKVKFTWEPLSESEVAAEYQAVGGFKVTGVVPEGMPMNTYSANIYVSTTDGSEAYLSISMKVKAPVTIRGLANQFGGVRFFEEAQFLDFGLVQPGRPAEMDLLFNYRTDKKGELDFQVAEVSHPEILDVTVKNVRRSETATVVMLNVAVKQDAPPALLNGPKRDNMASIKLVTDSEEAAEINLSVAVSKN
jgi:hypothetical protein